MKKPNNLLRKTYCAVVNVDEPTKSAFVRLSNAASLLWNKALVVCETWLDPKIEKEQKKPLTAFSLNYWLTEARKSETLSMPDGTVVCRVCDLSTDMSREVLCKLAGSWQSFFELRKKNDKRARAPRAKSGAFFMTLSWSTVKIEDGVLTIPGISKEKLRIPLGRYLTKCVKDKEVKHATVSRTESGEYKLSLVCGSPLPSLVAQPTQIRAIDLGAGSIVVSDSSGEEFSIPTRRPDKFWRKKIGELENRVKRCKRGSRAYDRRMKARRNMHNKSGAQHTDHQRKIAYSLIKGAQVIVIGKMHTRLGLSQSSGTPDQHWGAQNTGYHMRILTFIKEKAAERGVHVIELPDPKRQGALDDSAAKFHASRALLEAGCRQFNVATPTAFVKREYVLKQ